MQPYMGQRERERVGSQSYDLGHSQALMKNILGSTSAHAFCPFVLTAVSVSIHELLRILVLKVYNKYDSNV